MREITSHKVNLANDTLTVQVHDQPGAGGANHLYAVYGFHTLNNPSADSTCRDETCLKVLFQNGPIGESDPPPMKWSALWYGFEPGGRIDVEEATQA